MTTKAFDMMLAIASVTLPILVNGGIKIGETEVYVAHNGNAIERAEQKRIRKQLRNKLNNLGKRHD